MLAYIREYVSYTKHIAPDLLFPAWPDLLFLTGPFSAPRNTPGAEIYLIFLCFCFLFIKLVFGLLWDGCDPLELYLTMVGGDGMGLALVVLATFCPSSKKDDLHIEKTSEWSSFKLSA